MWAICQNMVQRKVRKGEYGQNDDQFVRFPPERRFRLLTQSYRKKIVLRSLLMNVFLGKNNSNVKQNIIEENENVVLFHVGSHRRAKEIFDIGGLNAAELQNRNRRFFAMCGKVQIKCSQNDVKKGYIINETKDSFQIQFTNNTTKGKCKKPVFDRNLGVYKYDNAKGKFSGDCRRSFQMTDYKPVRVQLSLPSGIMKITTNRMVYEKKGKTSINLIALHCS